MTSEPPPVVMDVTPGDFDEFFEVQSPRLSRLAYLLLRDRGAAQDVTQDVMLEIYRRWDSFSSQTHAIGYARTSVLNRSRSVHRRRVVAAKFMPRLHAPPPPEADLTEKWWMREALAQLSVRQREVLVLRYWCDLSEIDIAETLGISVGTVKSTASRGLDQLGTIIAALRKESS